jgi:hypothetical protein
MHDTKLTIRISSDLLENAKDFAKQNNTTLTNLIEAYLRRIPARRSFENAPIVRSLIGTLTQDVSIDDYKKHLDQKYDD